MWHDLRRAARTLLKSPGFTLLATLTLALGIGANTAIFSLVHALFLRPLPGVEEPGELLGVYATFHGNVRASRVSYPDYLDYRETADAFSGLAAHSFFWGYLQDGADSVELQASAVTGDFFTVLGLVPRAGRFFLPEEDARVDAHPVAVVSHRFWQRRFEKDPGVVGRSLRVNEVDVTVVGIAPEGFDGLGQKIDLWVPTGLARIREPYQRERTERGLGWLDLVGRLAPGRTLAEARTALEHRAARVAEAFPETHAERGVYLAPIRGVHPASVGSVAQLPRHLGAAVSVMLLIVCANLAGLMTARNARRAQEMAVRRALGASRPRLLRQLSTEGVVLALAGGFAGLAVARGLVAFLGSFDLYGLANLEPGFEPVVLVFALAASLVTGIVFTLMPALQASGADVVTALKNEVRGSHRSPLRAAMVTTQVALSLVLLLGAGLVLQSLDRLVVRPGFTADNFAHFRLRANRLGYGAGEAAAYHREVMRRLSALSGVEDVVLSRIPPQRGWCCERPVSLPGSEGEPLSVENNEVTPGFFGALGIPLVAGRDFGPGDTPESPPVVIVNEALAERLWGTRSPLGRTLLLAETPHEVIGMTADTHPARAGEGPLPFYYRSFWQAGMRSARLFVRVKGDPGAAIRPLREELSRIDPAVHVGQDMALAARVRMSYELERLVGLMLSCAGFVGLFLSAVGLYGAIAFTVARRTRELGIRAALGARAADAARLVLGQALRFVGLGLLIGGVLAVWAADFLTSLLYGVEPGDPSTFLGVALLLTAVGLAAGTIPTRRAMRVDPAVALRYD